MFFVYSQQVTFAATKTSKNVTKSDFSVLITVLCLEKEGNDETKDGVNVIVCGLYCIVLHRRPADQKRAESMATNGCQCLQRMLLQQEL